MVLSTCFGINVVHSHLDRWPPHLRDESMRAEQQLRARGNDGSKGRCVAELQAHDAEYAVGDAVHRTNKLWSSMLGWIGTRISAGIDKLINDHGEKSANSGKSSLGAIGGGGKLGRK